MVKRGAVECDLLAQVRRSAGTHSCPLNWADMSEAMRPRGWKVRMAPRLESDGGRLQLLYRRNQGARRRWLAGQLLASDTQKV